MAQVIWTQTALNQLREILDYVSQQSPANAEKLRVRLVQAPRILETFPQIGYRVAEFEEPDHVRELIVKPFRMIYVIRENQCYVAYVIRASRDLKAIVSLEELESLD
jgi:plasmid stabilization system protein ParE